MYYSSVGALALIVHLIINYPAMKRPNLTCSLARKRYRHFLFGITLFYVADILWGSLYGLRFIGPCYVDTIMFFLTMVLSLLLWTRYVIAYLDRKGHFGAFLSISGWAIFIFEVLALILNFFVPVVFSFSETKEYMPGHARYITLASQVLLFTVCTVYTFFVAAGSEGKAKRQYLTIGLSGLTMTVFVVLQTAYPLLPLYAAGCLIASCLIHTFVALDREEDFERDLGSARQLAYQDPLTSVKNRAAYLEARALIDERIRNNELSEFAVVVFDLDGLKVVNDTFGHDAGDRYIKEACELICKKFKYSPVYRIGGDEFAAFLEGEDYMNRTSLLSSFEEKVRSNLSTGHVVVSSGIGVFDPRMDTGYDMVFERADRKMYERKRALKNVPGVSYHA